MRMFLATWANPHFERYGVQDIGLTGSVVKFGITGTLIGDPVVSWEQNGRYQPKILPVCDYYHHRPFLALIGDPVVSWE